MRDQNAPGSPISLATHRRSIHRVIIPRSVTGLGPGSLARMTYFADLTPYLYGLPEPEPDVLNIGWLDAAALSTVDKLPRNSERF